MRPADRAAFFLTPPARQELPVLFSSQNCNCVSHSLYLMEYSEQHVVPHSGSAVEHLRHRPPAESGHVPSRHDSDEVARVRRSVGRRVRAARFTPPPANLAPTPPPAFL